MYYTFKFFGQQTEHECAENEREKNRMYEVIAKIMPLSCS
jgi:hypothetical protein